MKSYKNSPSKMNTNSGAMRKASRPMDKMSKDNRNATSQTKTVRSGMHVKPLEA